MSDESTIGREPITIIEIDQDLCSRTYGVAPCTAALGVTGSTKCFNTIASCQDPDNYALGDPLTLSFSTPVENNFGRSRGMVLGVNLLTLDGEPLQLDGENLTLGYSGVGSILTLIPSLVSVSTIPTRINVAASSQDATPLGERATVTIILLDHPYHDRLVDPYASERDYDAMARGSFWSKWLVRNPYHQGRAVRIRQGYVGQALAEMRVRRFVIDRIDGPTKGQVTITGKDPLKLLDDDRVRAPDPNAGELVADISDVDMSFTLAPAGVGNSNYAASGVISVGGELMTFTRSADAVTITARALRGTSASQHAAGDAVQEVLVITSERVDLLLADLMTNYAGIDASLIPAAEWAAEATLWCSGFNLSAWIAEPSGVATLVSQILEETGCFIWWDDEAQHIKFRATRPFYPLSDESAIEIDQDAHVVADSLSIVNKPEERITRVFYYWAMINPTGADNDPANFARRRVLTADDSESVLRYGDSHIKTIFGRFLDEANDATTSVVSTRILERYRETPKLISFATDIKDNAIKAGSVVRLTHNDIVDLTGAATGFLLQITSREEVEPGHRLKFEAQPYLSRTHYAFIMEDSAPDYSAATDDEKDTGGFIADDVTGFSNGDLPYRIL